MNKILFFMSVSINLKATQEIEARSGENESNRHVLCNSFLIVCGEAIPDTIMAANEICEGNGLNENIILRMT